MSEHIQSQDEIHTSNTNISTAEDTSYQQHCQNNVTPDSGKLHGSNYHGLLLPKSYTTGMSHNLPPIHQHAVVTAMARDLNGSSCAPYGNNMQQNVSAEVNMWPGHDYMSRHMGKGEPFAAVVDNIHDTDPSRYSPKISDQMSALEKASIDFLTGCYFRNNRLLVGRSGLNITENQNQGSASITLDHVAPDLTGQAAGSVAQPSGPVASGLVSELPGSSMQESGPISSVSQTFSLVSKPYVSVDEVASIPNQAHVLHNPVSGIHDSSTDLLRMSSTPQDSLESRTIANFAPLAHPEDECSSSAPGRSNTQQPSSASAAAITEFSHTTEDPIVDESSQQDTKVLKAKQVTLEEACRGLRKALSYLEMNPDWADDHIETLRKVLKHFNKRKKKVKEMKICKNFEVKTEVNIEEEHVEVEKGKYRIWKTRPHKCTLCSQRFIKVGNLEKHFVKCSNRKPAKCTICDKVYTTVRNLSTHMRKHTGERPYLCTTCGKSFSQNGTLQAHMSTHTGELPFSCAQCEKRFSRASNLKRHLVVHTGERPHMCCECGKSYPRPSDLQIHMRVHTGERRYKCPHCTKAFIRHSTLNDHIKIHTGAKPHKCTTCGQAFAQACSLRRHIRIHTGERPYCCSICGETFAQSGTLNHHRKVHDSNHKSHKENFSVEASSQEISDVGGTNTEGHDSQIPLYPHYNYNMMPQSYLP